MALWIRGYRKRQKRLAALLPWDTMETPSVMRLQNGSRMAVLHIAGPDLQSALAIELVTQASQLNHLFRRYGKQWGFQAEVRRRQHTTYPKAQWPNWLCEQIDQERSAQWAQGDHFTNSSHLTIVHRPTPPLQKGFRTILYEHDPDQQSDDELELDEFEEEVSRIQSMLKAASIQNTLLATSALMTYLHNTVSTKEHRVAMPDPACYLNTYLSDCGLRRGMYPLLGERWYLGCVTPHAWVDATSPGMFDILNELPVEYRAVWRMLPWDKQEAVAKAKKSARQWESKQGEGKGMGHATHASQITNRSALDHSQEAQEAWRRVEKGEISYNNQTTTVVVWASSIAQLKRKLQLVEGAFNACNMVAYSETIGTQEAWLGTIPGEMVANGQQDPMHSYNFAHCFPATNPWPGQLANTHLGGGSLFHATGLGQSSVGISLHEGDVGHFGVIGSTGDGKSTLLNWICTQKLRYAEHEICIFDLRWAALRTTAMMEGYWYDVGKTPLQPLANIDEEGEIGWQVEWLENLLLQERLNVTPAMKEELNERLLTMAEWDRPRRTMDTLAELVEQPDMQQAIRLYGTQGPYRGMVDGNRDPIADHRWLCFELEAIWDRPAQLNIVMPALIHRLEQRLRGQPTLYTFHEGWIVFDVPFWEHRLRAWLKGLRVRNGAVGFASQSPTNIVESRIAGDLFVNMDSWIFTPNPKAMTEDNINLYAKFGLNARECERIAHAEKKRHYYLKQLSGEAMIDLTLGPIALETCSTPYAGEIPGLIDQIAQHQGHFAQEYLTQKGLVH